MDLAERLGRRRKRRYGRGNKQPNARHRHQPPGNIVLLGAADNPGFQFRIRRFELSQCSNQDLP